MPTSISITPGKVVHFTLRNARKHRPAIITRLRNDGTVDLHVMTTSMPSRRRNRRNSFNVRKAVYDGTGLTPGTWHEVEFTAPRNVRTIDDVRAEVAASLQPRVDGPVTANDSRPGADSASMVATA